MMMPHTQPVGGPLPQKAAACRGYTLVEVLLSLVLLSLIGTTVTSLLFGFSRNADNRQDLRRRNAAADVVGGRIDAAIRPCAMLLAAGESFVVLWTADSNPNTKPDLSELCRIEWDATSGEIRSYRAIGIESGADVTYEPAADFAEITAGLRGSAEFPHQTMAVNVAGWSLPAYAMPREVRLVSFVLTLRDERGDHAVRSAVALRGRIADGR